MIKTCTYTKNQYLAFRGFYNIASVSKIIIITNGKVTINDDI